MKKVPDSVCCSRCGDDIPAEDLVQSSDHLCVFCSNMRLEAEQVAQNQRQRLNAHKASIRPVPVSRR